VTASAAGSASGVQFPIRHREWQATVTEVGATLRTLSHAGVALLDGFESTERAGDGRGQVLAPWPNRIDGGRYTFGGREVQAPLNETERKTAIHGLVRWLPWTCVDQQSDSVTLRCTVFPQPGYEWQLDVEVTYAVGDEGLSVAIRATNVDDVLLPLGVGCHPYLLLGDSAIDELSLLVPATRRLDMSGDGLQQQTSVLGTEWDFTTSRTLSETKLDTAYGGLLRDPDGRARAKLVGQGGRGVQLWVDGAFDYLMVYTADSVSQPERRRRAVAIEPMTCPPQAFRTGTSVIKLAPRESWTGMWGIDIV
jgi:aldose 1-epimerase